MTLSFGPRYAARLFRAMVVTAIGFAQLQGNDSTRLGFEDVSGLRAGTTYGGPTRPMVAQHVALTQFKR